MPVPSSGRFLAPITARPGRLWLGPLLLVLVALAGCPPAPPNKPGSAGQPVHIATPTLPQTPSGARQGDEIAIGGWLYHTGTRVVLWSDPGGLNGYAGENPARPRRFEFRTDAAGKPVRHDPARLAQVVDQFVLHYDGSGTSSRCYRTLVQRGLSVHFMIDLDGTIYQMLDVQEKAYHATIVNNRAVGVEIANVGAFEPGAPDRFAQWYYLAVDGKTYLRVPPKELRVPGVYKPWRDQPVEGVIQGRLLRQYDFTLQQYAALARLTATLCTVLPRIRCDYPRDAHGRLYPAKLPDAYLQVYTGVLGHYHIQTNKIDPGPALAWDYVIGQARRLMTQP